MVKDILILPDQHAHPDFNNDRADWASRLIIDIQPDIVVNMGDAADMNSLSDYDRGKRSFVGRSYKKDIDSHLEFQERLWEPVRQRKKKLPRRIVIEGNHEHRVERVLDAHPELEGTVSFNDYDFNRYYDEVIRYDGSQPGTIEVEGILFSHFLPAGVRGLPVSGDRAGHLLLNKYGQSCVVAHSHLFDYAWRITNAGRSMHGVVAGCYQDYNNAWAGNLANQWARGITILRDVEEGSIGGIEFIGMKRIENEYGRV